MNPASTTRKSQFAHFLNHTINELEYRLMQILEVCTESLYRFETKKEPRSGEGRELNFRFAAFSSLVQTIKDILPVLLENDVSWSSLNSVRHLNFIKQSRNAITHDGNPIINLWADGRFYVACDFVRLNQSGSPELVKVPTEDIATICLEFTADFATKIVEIIKPLTNNHDFTGPMYGVEFFDEAVEHPAIPAFAKKLYKESPVNSGHFHGTPPLEDVFQKLSSLIAMCNAQLK